MPELTQELVKRLFYYDPDTGVLTWKIRPCSDFIDDAACRRTNTRNAGRTAGGMTIKTRTNRYMTVQVFGVGYRMHRIIYLWVYGRLPTKQIDHIDGNGLNNKICNLRDVSATNNRRNSGIGNTNSSGTLGVSWRKCNKKWEAHIGVNNKNVRLGTFDTKDEAIKARKAAELRYGYHPNHGTRRASKP